MLFFVMSAYCIRYPNPHLATVRPGPFLPRRHIQIAIPMDVGMAIGCLWQLGPINLTWQSFASTPPPRADLKAGCPISVPALDFAPLVRCRLPIPRLPSIDKVNRPLLPTANPQETQM